MPWSRGQITLERGGAKKLLSGAYREYLGMLVDEQTRLELKLPNGAVWADAIANQVVRRAVGLKSKEQVCFTAITELREATEGKIAEKVISAGNDELAALARAISGEPAAIPADNPSSAEDL